MALESASHYVLVAGEPSGDALGADLMLAIRAEQPNAQFSGVGGQLMQAAGLDPSGSILKLCPSMGSLHRF